MSFPRYPKYKPSGVQWLGDVPEHWDVRRLGYFFRERREKVSDRDFEPLSVTMQGIVPRIDTAAKTDDGDNRKKVCVGDFVINSRSDRKGSAGVSPLNGSVSLISTVLEPQPEVIGSYVHHLLRSIDFQEEYYRYGKGIVADLWSTNYSEMRNISLAMPGTSEQAAIAGFLDRETSKIDSLVGEQRRLIELLKEKRQAVISHAVTKGLNPQAPLKPSGIQWLGDVPEHWDVTPIGHLCDSISYGFTNPMPTTDEGPFLLTANDVDYGNVKYETARRTSYEAFQNDLTEKSRPKKDDVLVTKDGTLGRVALHDGREACINQSVASLRVKPNSVLPQFMATCLLGGIYQGRMIYDAGGTTIKHIYISRLAKMPIAYPSPSEQDEVLAFLREELAKLDALSAEAERAIELLQERRTALISAAVTGKIDVRNVGGVAA